MYRVFVNVVMMGYNECSYDIVLIALGNDIVLMNVVMIWFLNVLGKIDR